MLNEGGGISRVRNSLNINVCCLVPDLKSGLVKINGGCSGRGCSGRHSRCLESICGDFLYIAVIVIGAIRRSRDY